MYIIHMLRADVCVYGINEAFLVAQMNPPAMQET